LGSNINTKSVTGIVSSYASGFVTKVQLTVHSTVYSSVHITFDLVDINLF